MPRSDAAEIFSMRLDHLGFMNYVIALAVIVAALVIIPFVATCCTSSRNGYLCSKLEPFIARIVILAAFVGMLLMVKKEGEQC